MLYSSYFSYSIILLHSIITISILYRIPESRGTLHTREDEKKVNKIKSEKPIRLSSVYAILTRIPHHTSRVITAAGRNSVIGYAK